jgi:peptidoglycan/LPS O-acetylase OafA/YrhL
MDFHFEVRADALLVGCALAMLLKNQAIRSWIERNGVWLFCLCVPAFGWHLYRYQMFPPLTESLLIALMIAITSILPSFAISKALEYKHLRFLGTISYSVYVWQQLFLMPRSGGFFAFFLPTAALGSWVLIERPCIRFERRLERRNSAAHHTASPVATDLSTKAS